jgi:hypothetical protein
VLASTETFAEKTARQVPGTSDLFRRLHAA